MLPLHQNIEDPPLDGINRFVCQQFASYLILNLKIHFIDSQYNSFTQSNMIFVTLSNVWANLLDEIGLRFFKATKMVKECNVSNRRVDRYFVITIIEQLFRNNCYILVVLQFNTRVHI